MITPRTKRVKLSGQKHRNPDFISQSPLMEVTTPVPASSTLLPILSGRFQRPIQFPRLQSTTGTLQTICLNSAFTQPHHCCLTRMCGDRKSVPRIPRLHIDLARDPWKTKPESYWLPHVTFLQNDSLAGLPGKVGVALSVANSTISILSALSPVATLNSCSFVMSS